MKRLASNLMFRFNAKIGNYRSVASLWGSGNTQKPRQFRRSQDLASCRKLRPKPESPSKKEFLDVQVVMHTASCFGN